ncbi:MAG: hypothetical protein Q4F00_12795 [bacterium]|nr:hypothetical protein [bacterium]
MRQIRQPAEEAFDREATAVNADSCVERQFRLAEAKPDNESLSKA